MGVPRQFALDESQCVPGVSGIQSSPVPQRYDLALRRTHNLVENGLPAGAVGRSRTYRMVLESSEAFMSCPPCGAARVALGPIGPNATIAADTA